MATPSLFRVIVLARDIEVASAFYAAVLGFGGERVSGGRHYFDCGGTILACSCPAGDGDAGPVKPLPDNIYLAVDDLEATLAAIEPAGGALASGEVHGEPAGAIARRPWGERSFYAIDPSGNPICFVERGSEFTGRG